MASKGHQRKKITMSDGNSIERSCRKLMPAVLLKLYKEYCCITKLMPRHGRERETERERVWRARKSGLQSPDYSLLWSGNPEREGLKK